MKPAARWLGWICAATWLGVVLAWLREVTGGETPAALERLLVAAGVGSLAALAAVVAAGVGRRREGEPALSSGRLLLGLVAISLLVRLTGIDWEVTGHYYRDEGIYYAAAQEINRGDLLPENFIYGHLPYYLYAIVLWIQSIFPQLLAGLTDRLFGFGREVDVSWLLLRGLNATLGALTTVPVFAIGRRIAGPSAACMGALLIIFSPLHNEISRWIISDVPAAFFATVALMFVARLLDEERLSDYLLAGSAAGLAAACKYPAGVVAVAIVAIWLGWRWRLRRWSWSLMWAGLVSLATFLAAMPAFWAHPGSAFAGEGKDLLFGLRQYGRGGWIGVMPGSNVAWYSQQLLVNFGLPALGLGVVGWSWLRREPRRRLVWMLAFPLLYLALMAAMSMVVKRNLLPVLPGLAACLGAGFAGWQTLIARRAPAARRTWLVAPLLVAMLALPSVRTTMQTVALARDSTREQAAAWIQARIPRGAAIIQESYTPHLDSKKYTVRKSRFAARLPLEEIRSGDWDYLLLAWNAYGRFLVPENWRKPHHELYARRYEQMLKLPLAQDFVPGRTRLGPTLQIFETDPENVEYRKRHRFVFDGASFRYPRQGAFLLLKEYFESGTYRLVPETEPPAADGRIRAVTRDNREAGRFPIRNGVATGTLPWRSKYFLYVYLPAGTEIRALSLLPEARAPTGESGSLSPPRSREPGAPP